ncbi:MAG: DUF4430 domain-containing protein [Actinobacteria bacterium]|nr:DUF4430 domain-containing protein [Actinomycetota bacterium]
MRTLRSTGLLTGILLASLALFSSSAVASMTVRIEGVTSTLVPRTTVTAGGADVAKPGGTCPGTTAAGALERATSGDWAGTWYDGLGFTMDRIKTQTLTFTDPTFWGFFANGVSVSVGVCQQAVQDGDDLVFAPIPNQSDFSVTLLDLAVPAAIRPGVSFTATVTQVVNDWVGYAPAGSVRRGPAAGATIVLPGGRSVTTGADGTADITLSTLAGADLRATRDGSIPSATVAACMTTGFDGRCGTAADRRAPRGQIATLRDGHRYALGRAPRMLQGRVAADPSGLRRVQLRLTRRVPATAGGRRSCQTYDAAQERWLGMWRCGATRGQWFTVGDRVAWSYLLPEALATGRYVLDVRLTDGAGNVSRGLSRATNARTARNRVIFLVG